jgi:hypothetical protein
MKPFLLTTLSAAAMLSLAACSSNQYVPREHSGGVAKTERESGALHTRGERPESGALDQQAGKPESGALKPTGEAKSATVTPGVPMQPGTPRTQPAK